MANYLHDEAAIAEYLRQVLEDGDPALLDAAHQDVACARASIQQDAQAREQFYADGEASYQDTLRTNVVYDGAEVHAYLLARVNAGTTGLKPPRPKPIPLDPTKPMKLS